MLDKTALQVKNRVIRTQTFMEVSYYVGHLESKERLRVQPAQLFNFS